MWTVVGNTFISESNCHNLKKIFFDVTEAKAAPRDCFIDVNSKGDRFGNCGFSGNEYKKCATG